MMCTLKLIKSDGTEVMPDYVMSFTFEKDTYTPYTRLSAKFLNKSNAFPEDCYGVKLRLNGKLLHFGVTDTYSIAKTDNCRIGTISSRGYTSMLLENQMPPGLYTSMTISRLFNSFSAVPNITHEQNSDLSYIYVKSGSSMWDALANLSYKLYGRYPYIKGDNKVMMSLPETPKSLEIKSTEIFEYGSSVDTRKIVSDFRMEDVNGKYNTYTLKEPEAVNRQIVRYRYFELDRRFLNDPDLACEYRNMMAKSGLKRRFLTYSEYKGEDLFDRVTGGGITDKPIFGIKITGSSRGIFTRLATEY